jgi:hypothetical protein
VRERSEDLEEVQAMVEAGELDIAIDELHWLLEDCHEFIAAHALLGELALAANNDLPLARGHFGAGYQLGLQALRRAAMPKPLLVSHPANHAFFGCGRSLAWCLGKLNKMSMAREVFDALISLDPSDPLQLRGMLEELQTGGKPIVDLLRSFPKTDDE